MLTLNIRYCKIFHQNLISVFRSSLTPRKLPSQKLFSSQVKCFICSQIKHKYVKEKYRLSEIRSASKILEAANHLMDEVYVRICHLGSPENILSAELHHHKICYTSYIRTYESSLCSKETTEYGPNELITKTTAFTKFIILVQYIIQDG